MNSVEQIRIDLLSCRQKIQTLVIKDFIKLLPITKTTFLKNEVMKFPDLQDRLDFDLEKEKVSSYFLKYVCRKKYLEISMLRKKIKNFDRSQSYLEDVQQLTENIQNTSNVFKQNMMELFDQLADEEAQIEQDLSTVDDFIEHCEQNPTVTTAPKPPLPKQGSARNLEEKENKNHNSQDELTEMKRKIDRFEERILLNGGKLCGWEDEEHTQFLKVRTKHHGKVRTQIFLDECANTIPIHSRDQICEHIDRFEKLCDLEDAKKILIAQYKQLKDDLKQQAIKKAEEEAKQVQQVVVKKSKEQNQAEREKQKEDLKQWKMKRISQKMVEQDIDFERKQEEEKQKRLRMQQELEEKKIIVNQYKEQKQMLQLRQKEAEQYQSMMKRHVSQDVKERIRAREEEMTEKRIQKLEQDKQKQLEKQMKETKKQEDRQVKYAYVEPKLLETTKATEQQKRTKFDPSKDQAKYANTFGGDLLGMGRRAIPNWRQGA